MLQDKGSMIEKNRVFWIDFAKFLGILFILLNHIGIKIPIVSQFGGMFYVPVFFVLAGYHFTFKKENIKEFAGRRAKRLLIPYVGYSVFLGIFFWLKDGWQIKSLFGILYARNSLYAQISTPDMVLMNIMNSPMWFLPALFLAEILFRLAVGAVKNDHRSILFISAISVFLGICFHYFSPVLLPWSLDSIFIFEAMMAFGYLLKEHRIIEKYARNGIVWSVSAIILVVLYFTNGPINVSIGDYGELLWAGFLMAILSSAFIMIICYWACNLRQGQLEIRAGGICSIVQSSIAIMCLHSFLFMCFEIGLERFGLFSLSGNGVGNDLWKLVIVVITMDMITIGRMICIHFFLRNGRKQKDQTGVAVQETINGKWNLYGAYAFYIQEGDWVDEDYAPVLVEQMNRLQTDIIISGVIRVRGNQFKRANFYEYEKTLVGKEGRKELLKKGYAANGFRGCLVKKELLEDKITNLYSLLLKTDRIGILNDYKYYHKEEEPKGFYQQADQNILTFQELEEKWNTYHNILVDWQKNEIWELFTKKEKILLQHSYLGKIICSFSNSIQKNHPNTYQKCQKIIDKQMEKRKKIDNNFANTMKKSAQEERIFIMGTPEYHNLGDHAIAYAQEKFCKNHFPKRTIINVTEEIISIHFSFLQRQIKQSDILLLQGGGNMGDEYGSIEELRLKIIQGFPNNKIVLMPQTIHFTNHNQSQKLLEKMKKSYQLHPKLSLTARENTSYKRMKSYFPHNQVIRCPDIVLSLDIQKETTQENRKGILLLLRTDAEGTLEIEQLLKLKKLCTKKSSNVKMTETSISHGIPEQDREQELLQKWKQISRAELVITDRLHGMIFSAITGTPCLVLSNYNHKIRESYEWIKKLEYIKFCNNLTEIEQHLKMTNPSPSPTYHYHNKELLPYYQTLHQTIAQ